MNLQAALALIQDLMPPLEGPTATALLPVEGTELQNYGHMPQPSNSGQAYSTQKQDLPLRGLGSMQWSGWLTVTLSPFCTGAPKPPPSSRS